MKYIISWLIIAFILYLIMKKNEKKEYKKTIQQLKREWGTASEEEYTNDKFFTLRRYYDLLKKEDTDVDDITWNDLDMNQIYMLINQTKSSIGGEYLYSLLRKPCFEQEELTRRNDFIHFFQKEEAKRLTLQAIFFKMGKLNGISVYEYMNKTNEMELKSNIPHYIMGITLLVSIGACIVLPNVYTLFFLISMFVNNILQYYKYKAKVDNYIKIVGFVIRMLNGIDDISKLKMEEIKQYTEKLKRNLFLFSRIRKNAYLVVSGSGMNGSLIDSFLDYERMLFHTDLIKLNSMVSIIRKQKEQLNEIFEIVGYLDSMLSIASFRSLIEQYCEPVLIKNKKLQLVAEQMYHPLIDEPVNNSIQTKKPILLTGSNASGKSTFIKTLAVNAILSQTIYTCMSHSYQANFFQIYSSMALRDDLIGKDSYYMVEIKSLKRILDRKDEEIPILCFVDEVLRGTNTLERVAASSQILASLACANTLCFAATHDIELTYMLEQYYENYYFTEQITEQEVIFDYKLRSGRAVSRNAIQLLKMIGYSPTIVNKATEIANEFLETGVWTMQ